MIWGIALGELPGGFHRLLPAACVLRAVTLLDRFECPPEFTDALSKIFANLRQFSSPKEHDEQSKNHQQFDRTQSKHVCHAPAGSPAAFRVEPPLIYCRCGTRKTLESPLSHPLQRALGRVLHRSLHGSIAMQAAQQKVDAKVGEKHAGETDQRKPGDAFAAPVVHAACVQHRSIYEPGNQ